MCRTGVTCIFTCSTHFYIIAVKGCSFVYLRNCIFCPLSLSVMFIVRPAAFFIGSLLSNTNMTHAMTNRVLSAATALNTDVVDSLRSKVIQTFEALGIDLENEECKNLLAEFDSKTNIHKVTAIILTDQSDQVMQSALDVKCCILL